MSLRIERLGLRGDGVAEGPVYVPRTLPGELVEGRVEAPHLLEPSPHRATPPCPHFELCGGCALQHASDEFVAAWKLGIVRESLERAGIDTDYRPVLTSPPNSRRRATLAARRTRKGALAGLHARASDTVIPIPDCRLLDPSLIAALPLVEALAKAGASRKGALRVTLTASPAGLDVASDGGREADIALRASLAALAEAHDAARLSWNGEVIAARRPPAQRFGGAQVVPPPGAFLQATPQGEAALTAAVAEAVGEAASIVDLFAGCGTFTLPLATRAAVHAVEGEAAMLRALDAGWRHAPGLRRVTTEARDLFRNPLLPQDLLYDAAVIDPPRAGAEAQTRALAASNIPRIAAVSCNPVTFARDAAILTAAGYRLDWVQVVDQFRWSPHVELAAQFTRTNAAGA